MTIKASSLLASIRQAYDERWGYVWGTRGQVWTQAQQDKATRDMTRKYGQKWVGKRVADCSGLLVWAFKQHGGSIYHGSNTQFNECVETGPLAGEVRIRRGTAVFQVSNGTRGHVGIYDGGGMVIEEHGTQAGIIKSPLATWDEWGVLKDSDLSGEIYETFDIIPMDTLKKGSKGEVVKWYQRCLVELGYDIGKAKDGTPLIDGIYGTEVVSATRAFQYDNGLTSDGMAGKKTMAKVKELMEDDEPDEDNEVDFDELVTPWDEMTLEEKVEDLNQRLRAVEGGESNG
jgi:hypothetical protein